MTFPVKSILQEEYACYLEGKAFEFTNQIAYAFTPYLEKESYNCKSFFNNLKKSTDLIAAIHSDIDEFPSIAKDWEEQRTNAIQMLKQLKLPFDMIDEKFYKSQEMKTVIKDLTNFNIPASSNTDIKKLPAARMMEYSQFMRVYQIQKTLKPNDVMDVLISCIVPYVDAVITENFQADVYKKAKKIISQISDLEIYRLRDIRTNMN